MRTVVTSRELPLRAERACELATRAVVLQAVCRPVFALRGARAGGLRVTDASELRVAPGTEVEARLWFAGVLPGWRHAIRVAELSPTRIATHEGGGPVRRWDHVLEFAPLGEGRCRYTDRVTIDAGLATPVVAAFAALMYRWRAHRWRTLIAPIAA